MDSSNNSIKKSSSHNSFSSVNGYNNIDIQSKPRVFPKMTLFPNKIRQSNSNDRSMKSTPSLDNFTIDNDEKYVELKSIRKITPDYDPQNDPSISSSDLRQLTLQRCNEDEMRLLIQSAIRRQVEIEIYVACAGRLRNILDRAFTVPENSLRDKIRSVVHQPQSYFGIPIQNLSPTSWDVVVYALRDIRLYTLPHDRLEALTDVCKMIPKVFMREHPTSEKPLGADEFLPIFIYVLVKAQLSNLLSLNEELQALCDPDKRLSETGYYLATLEASLQHLNEANPDSSSLFVSSQIHSSHLENSLSDNESDGESSTCVEDHPSDIMKDLIIDEPTMRMGFERQESSQSDVIDWNELEQVFEEENNPH
jgi:hypothetical protein